MIEDEEWWKIWDWGGVILLCRHCPEMLASVVISKGAVDRRRGGSGTTFCVSNSLQLCLDDLRISPKQSRRPRGSRQRRPVSCRITMSVKGHILKGPRHCYGQSLGRDHVGFSGSMDAR